MGANERTVQDLLQRARKRKSGFLTHGVHHISGTPAHRSRAHLHEVVILMTSIPKDLLQFDAKLLRAG
jgi:hypothetical protein